MTELFEKSTRLRDNNVEYDDKNVHFQSTADWFSKICTRSQALRDTDTALASVCECVCAVCIDNRVKVHMLKVAVAKREHAQREIEEK